MQGTVEQVARATVPIVNPTSCREMSPERGTLINQLPADEREKEREGFKRKERERTHENARASVLVLLDWEERLNHHLRW